jgi:glycosyltransferase involved in cell wall biosynthesis
MDVHGTRVGLDGFFLSQPATGSGQYTVHLWRRLASAESDPDVMLLRPASVSLGRDGRGKEVAVQPPPFVRSAKARKVWWEQAGVLRALRRSGANLLHVPYLSAPRVSRRKTVVTIHDLIPMIYPDYGGSAAMRVYLRLVVPAARRAALILTDSDCSRRDIVRLLHVDAGRVRSIPLAVDEAFRPDPSPQREAELRSRIGIDGPIIFNVGGLDMRKNLGVLIEAFGRALPNLDPSTVLVIGGQAHTGNDRLYPPLEPIIRKWGLDGKVKLTGRISDEDKLILYQIANLYVYPSLYEGFGLTPLEAMACGLPVIAANRSSLPEVVGTGGLLIDPTPARFAAAIVSVLSDEHLRRELSQRALAQASRFSWEQTAEQTRAAYLEALG